MSVWSKERCPPTAMSPPACSVIPPIAWATLFWKATQRNSSSCFHSRASVKRRVIHLITLLLPVPGDPWQKPKSGCSDLARSGFVL